MSQRKIEWLVMAGIVVAIIMGGIIAYFDLSMGLRDTKRRADIGIIAGALEIHFNDKAGQFCPSAPLNSYCHPQYPWFQGGVPVDPLWGDYLNLPQTGDKQFLICAKLERGDGNAASTDGTPAQGRAAIYYCQKNQQ